MKRLWWLLPVVLLAAGSLVFFGCGGGDDDDDLSVELGALNIKLVKNPYVEEWDGEKHGFQGFLVAEGGTNPINGIFIKKGDTYTLEIEYTVDRDIDDCIQVGLVNNEGDWVPLCSDGTFYEIKITGGIKADTKYTEKIKFEAVASAPKAGGRENNILFQTPTEKQTLNEPTLKFTKFNFKKE